MERKNIRVLHMLTTDRYSGAENVVCQIAHIFRDDQKYEMLYSSPDGPIREALSDRKVSFVPMKAASLTEFRRVIRAVNPDIVHAHDMRASFLAALVCGKKRIVSHVHVNNFDSHRINLKVMLYRFAAHKAKQIIWVSESSFRGYLYHEELKHKSTVLYNIIDAHELREKVNTAQYKEQYDIVYIGRLTYQKNPQRLIEVIERVVQQVPTIRCALIGSGDLEEEIRALVEKKGLGQHIHLLGFMSNPYAVLANAKVMLMTSRREGTPMCALEAIALGVPIVSTPTDGLCELITEGYNGFLSDDNQELSQQIVRIISEKELWSTLSQNALKKANQILDTTKYRNKLIELYQKGKIS